MEEESLQVSTTDVEESGVNVGNIIKKCWICLQVTMMIAQMTYGTIKFWKKVSGCSKMKMLFVFMFCAIIYLCINEFMHHNFIGMFLLLLFAQWAYFSTFSLVIDSCITKEDDENRFEDRVKTFNYVFRIIMTLWTLFLFVSMFFYNSCEERIYPWNFTAMIVMILTHQAYDLYLITQDYMIDWESLPPISSNKLRFNK